jgi:RNA polymerase sigma factor (TIGR02999 family)
MSEPASHEVTQLLLAWGGGDEEALNKLVPLIHAELHRLARHYMRQERAGHTLQTTALVNEAYLKLVDWRNQNVQWQNRAHFFGVSAQVMRHILVDHARASRYQKRGGGQVNLSLDEALTVSTEKSADLVALDDALKSLARIDERKARIVELRFFGGLSVDETAEVLKISPRTVMRDWSLAQAWLYRELSREGKDES